MILTSTNEEDQLGTATIEVNENLSAHIQFLLQSLPAEESEAIKDTLQKVVDNFLPFIGLMFMHPKLFSLMTVAFHQVIQLGESIMQSLKEDSLIKVPTTEEVANVLQMPLAKH